MRFDLRPAFLRGSTAVAAVIAGVFPAIEIVRKLRQVRRADRVAAHGRRRVRRPHRQAGGMRPFCSPATPPCWPSTSFIVRRSDEPLQALIAARSIRGDPGRRCHTYSYQRSDRRRHDLGGQG